MKHITPIIAIVSIVSIMSVFPHVVRAQEEQPQGTNEDVLSITARAEESVMNVLPQGVKDFFAKTFHGVETFRLNQITTASAKRDALQLELQAAQAKRNAATDENRDKVEQGTASSLYDNMGQRLTQGAPLALVVKYYAYKYYVMFVSSPVLFYLLGSFVIVYIIGTLIHRARKRGE